MIVVFFEGFMQPYADLNRKHLKIIFIGIFYGLKHIFNAYI
jgi:hypothetical protein